MTERAGVIRWLDVAAMRSEPAPPVPWVVEPLLARGAVTLLVGVHGVGKSLLALAALAAVGRGDTRFAGLDVGGGGGGGLLLDAENGEQVLHARTQLVDLPVSVQIGLPPPDFNLRRPDELADAIGEHAPALVVLDSLSSLAPGFKENEVDQGVLTLEPIRRLARETNAAVLLLHHTPKRGDSARGSTAIPAGVDVAVFYGRPRGSADPARRILDWSHDRGGKMRLGAEPDPQHVRVEVQAGRLTIEAAEPPSAGEQERAPKRAAIRLDAVAYAVEHGPIGQADLLRGIGLDGKDRTGRRALDEAIDRDELAVSDGLYGPPGGNGATPATATRHPESGRTGGRQPLEGLPPATPSASTNGTGAG